MTNSENHLTLNMTNSLSEKYFLQVVSSYCCSWQINIGKGTSRNYEYVMFGIFGTPPLLTQTYITLKLRGLYPLPLLRNVFSKFFAEIWPKNLKILAKLGQKFIGKLCQIVI